VTTQASSDYDLLYGQGRITRISWLSSCQFSGFSFESNQQQPSATHCEKYSSVSSYPYSQPQHEQMSYEARSSISEVYGSSNGPYPHTGQ
jgi:hypothetical protein